MDSDDLLSDFADDEDVQQAGYPEILKGKPKSLDEIDELVKRAEELDRAAKETENLADAIVHRCQNQISM